MPRKSPPPRLPPLAPLRPISPVSLLGTTYRTSPVSPLTPSPPLFRPVQFKSPELTSPERTSILRAAHHTQPECRAPTATPAPAPAPTEPEAETLPIPPLRPERPQSRVSHPSINALPQRPEWSDPALEARIARNGNERKAQRELYILMALVFVLGIIFLIVWLQVSHAGQ